MCICPIGNRHITKASNVDMLKKNQSIQGQFRISVSFTLNFKRKLNLLVIMMRKHLLHPSSRITGAFSLGRKKHLLAEQLRGDWQNLVVPQPTGKVVLAEFHL